MEDAADVWAHDGNDCVRGRRMRGSACGPMQSLGYDLVCWAKREGRELGREPGEKGESALDRFGTGPREKG